MGELNKTISGIRNMMKEMKVEMYAIENSDLIALDEYNKNLYLKVLCTVIQYENEPSDMQVLFLKRIIKGIGVDEPLEEYMRKALEISETNIQEFISFMKENKERYYFALESMLLVAMGNTQKNMEYLAELIEICGITKLDLEYLSLVAKSILQQESSYYEMAKTAISEGTRGLNFYPYIKNYYAGAIVDNDVEKYYFSPDLEMKSEIDLPTEYQSRIVTLINLNICLEDNWYFTGCERVELINCRFTTSKSSTLNFNAIGCVSIRECEFKDFDNHLAFFDAVNEIDISSCFLCNCGWTCSGDERGSLFRLSNPDNNKVFRFDNNKVQNCYIKAREYRYNYGVTGILLHADNRQTSYNINNNEFIGCQCINNGNYTAAIISGLNGKGNNFFCSDNQLTGEVTRLFEYN